ncbi:hypothetical protein QQY66_47480 [Streptomyces sp. DG2A-72]|uniref:hypothetical protein n=1 Tax=Streptomyces sp. DG2A-72 TaxID=3051386 RepID=UPI00265B959E|nr:hypothetical protein [Streptomyces sp. DG2A-72]MDO0938991.1 hypothetical protein [Streptomyces sp. DG2A-72]
MDTLHLLNVRFTIAPDTGGWRMTWEPLAEITLGGQLQTIAPAPVAAGSAGQPHFDVIALSGRHGVTLRIRS